MKFAKELERDLVPEWRLKYLDYKQGKKKLKNISRALRNVTQTPRFRHRGTSTFTASPFEAAPKYSFLNRSHGGRNAGEGKGSGDLRALAISNSQTSLKGRPNGSRATPAKDIRRSPEEQPLREGLEEAEFPGLTRYGSIVGSPPDRPTRLSPDDRRRVPSSLKLPESALDPEPSPSPRAGPSNSAQHKPNSIQLPPSTESDAFHVGKTRSPNGQSSTLPTRYRSIFAPKRVNSMPSAETPRPLVHRLFSVTGKSTPPSSPGDVPLEAFRDLDARQAEFFTFLDMELEKIETFYKEKEDEATERLQVLREQLHIMRDRRVEDLINLQSAKMKAKRDVKRDTNGHLLNGQHGSSEDEDRPSTSGGHVLSASWLKPIDSALEAVKVGRYGTTTKGMHDLGTPAALRPQPMSDDRRDYVRHPEHADVPYRAAKRKLKTALQEYYRGLELLKSYALLNRTAFRKINKKYDKTVNARPSMRYMTEKLNKAWFVKSDVLEGHIRVVEDLYARYFENGNHKVAVGKLRIKTARAGDFTENSFRNGLMLAAGLVFGVQGLVFGIELLFSDDHVLAVRTSYLLQIYCGYFLMNFLFLLFCMACRVWHESRINYIFVFEYDTRHHLDWRQLSELPCFFLFLLGFFLWLNFNRFGSETLYLYYPVILIGISVLMLFFPAPILYHRSRLWLLYSTNIELFFCLYAQEWDQPQMCNSSHARLMGFFAALPAIWRALQCIRRYYDTRNVFPHLVNCGKYTATILFYITLSIYRINKVHETRAIFITFAVINSIYCSIWDVVMDWSLGDPHAHHPFLRDTLGYKRIWTYYVAMALDPLLRFNWIFYAIWPIELQHSAVLSFVVAFSEVCRRGMWTLFRVENEHCTNVGRFRASRDVPLPYDVPASASETARTSTDHQQQMAENGTPHTSLRRTSTAPVAEHLPANTPGSQARRDLDIGRGDVQVKQADRSNE
ncbi:SPX domain-domain-containing protein [Clohesyomyces aquaticus]|uniref:SPX domain-domain-containing protein n=1 Tax=Clohesyomyces aquaticus TaxID=1231657 RepID=A0A1Y1YDZ6_9PLEO|nr:SPX domain-domain-containing protein [Clohesyomyces aquaticus]